MVTAAAWRPSAEELITCADDNTIKRINADDFTADNIVDKLDGYVTDLSWCPTINAKNNPDTFAICCSDGTFRIMQAATGREEKKVEAYKACAAISICWNHDGSALATGGEDGCVKVWSRVGMLRNTVASTRYPIYCICWGRQDEILYCSGKTLTIEQKERKQTQWKGHDGTILSVEWNPVNNLIVSGGEDCKYRVWDAYGRQLFQSQPLEHVVTCVRWSPNGSCFAVGAFNVLKICDKTGWTHCREDLYEAGSLLSLTWTHDGTLLGGACAGGAVVVAEVANRILEWKHMQVSLKEARRLEVYNTLDDMTEVLVFRDRVIDVSIEWGYLLVHCSTPQVHVYGVNNLTAPLIVDATPTRTALLLQSSKLFMAAWTVFSYEGRRVCAPQVFNGINVNVLDRDSVTMNDKYIAVLENNRNSIRLIDLNKQQPIGLIKHKLEIVQIALCKHQEDVLAFIDRNGDLFVHLNGRKTFKLPTTMVQSIHLNDQSDTLVACTDGGNKMIVWYYPQVVWVDPDLLADTSIEIETPHLAAKQPKIISFNENLVTVRKQDGSIVSSSVSRYPALLHQLVVEQRKWEDAIRLCRFVNQKFLWAILAGMAIKLTHLDTAEIALAATEHVAKLNYILYIKDIPSEKARMAELALYKRDTKNAEQILLHANPPMLYRAVKINIRLFRWERAREIAKPEKDLVKLVELYHKQWKAQQILSSKDAKEMKRIKAKYSDKSQEDSDEDEEVARNEEEATSPVDEGKAEEDSDPGQGEDLQADEQEESGSDNDEEKH